MVVGVERNRHFRTRDIENTNLKKNELSGWLLYNTLSIEL